MGNRGFLLLTLGLVLVGGLLVVGLNRGWFGKDRPVVRQNALDDDSENGEEVTPPAKRREIKARPLSEALGIPEDEIVEVGGIKRPKRDVAARSETDSDTPPNNPLPTAGKLPALKGDENPQVAGLFRELQDPDGPIEARSAMFLPQEFDREKYLENPEEYLNQIRPGRVFKPAVPGPGVLPIAPQSERMTRVLQGEKVVLEVKADPGNPVTFYTPDGGEFDNRLKTISVAANEEGVARAIYTAVPGTRGIMDVLAASPLHSGQVRFAIKVLLPE